MPLRTLVGPLVAALAAALLCAPAPAAAQAVLVRTVSDATGRPLAGVMVSLVRDGAGFQRGVLTDGEGRARFLALEPGTYGLRAELIGHETVHRSGLDVVPGRSAQVELRLADRVIELQGLSVDGEERCRVRPEEGLQVAAVWDEARKGLEGARHTEEAGIYRFRIRDRVTDLDEAGREVGRDVRTRTLYASSPYTTPPPAELVERGFVQDPGDGLGAVYYAPDAEVLLSDAFLDTHCMRLIRGRGPRDGLVGLTFEPVDRPRSPDIGGTLWLDPATWALVHLDYRYVGVRDDVALDDVGGDVSFERLDDGRWMVPEWSIRMPRLARWLDGRGRSRLVQRGVRERRGTVLSFQEVGGRGGDRGSADGATGSLDGRVVAEEADTPVAGATVRVPGAGLEATTDPAGRFRFEALSPGDHDLVFDHPDLAPFGFRPEPRTVRVEAGVEAAVRLTLPGPAALAREVCGEPPPAPSPGVGAVVGRVLDGPDRLPVEGATVVVAWEDIDLFRTAPDRLRVAVEGRGTLAVTAADGTWRACAVPRDAPLAVTAHVAGVVTPPDTVRIDRGAPVLVHDLHLERGRR